MHLDPSLSGDSMTRRLDDWSARLPIWKGFAAFLRKMVTVTHPSFLRAGTERQKILFFDSTVWE